MKILYEITELVVCKQKVNFTYGWNVFCTEKNRIKNGEKGKMICKNVSVYDKKSAYKTFHIHCCKLS